MNTLIRKFQSLFQNEESGIKVYGNNWFARYSNTFKDRENEFFSEKAIDEYIDRVDHGVVPLPELWVWHEPIKIGKAKNVFRIDHFVCAVGIFPDTSVGQAAKAYLSTHKAKMSHGFAFDPDTFKDATYHDFNTFEITVLPFAKGVEANAYTNFEVKDMTLTQEKEAFLIEMFGEDVAKQLIADTQKVSKSLEDLKVQYKDFANIAALKAEGNMPMDDEEDDPKKKKPVDGEDDTEDGKTLSKKTMAGLYEQLIGDFAELAEGQHILAKALKDTNEKVMSNQKTVDTLKADHAKAMDALRKENESLRKELDLTPSASRASQAAETVIEDASLKKSLTDKEAKTKDPLWNFALDQ